jgi:hypothetical protein
MIQLNIYNLRKNIAMKQIIFLILLIIPLYSFAQKTKSSIIFKSSIINIGISINYNGDSPIDTSCFIIAKDYQYQYSYQNFTLKSGTIEEVKDFLIHCKLFLNAETDGTSETYEGNHISVSNYMGIKGLYMFGNNSDSYCVLGSKQLSKYISAIDSYLK